MASQGWVNQTTGRAMNRILFVLGAGVAMAMSAVPAMAGRPLPVPEPATMSLLAVGIGGAYVARKFFGRK